MSGRTFIKVITLGAALYSTSLYAAATSTSVTLADTTPLANEYSFTALALRPAASNLNYVIFNKELPAQSPTWRENEIKPSYSFAFALGYSHLFAEGRDINLTWTHLYNSSNASTTAPNASYFLGPDYEIGPDSLPIRNATGKAVFHFDVINLDVGQNVQFGPHVHTHFFAGLSNGYLSEEVTSNYSGNLITGPFQGPFNTNQQVTSRFAGLGPRIGADGGYTFDNGFGFFGEAAVSALIGNLTTKTDYLSSGPELLALYNQTSNYQNIADQTVTQVIPGIDANVGINYKKITKNNAVLSFSLGYQAAVYINAIGQYLPASLVVPMTTGGIFVATMAHTQSNYSVQGPFFKASVAFS